MSIRMSQENYAVESADGTEVASGMSYAAARTRAAELTRKARLRLGDSYVRERDGFFVVDYAEVV